jgi:hypothetical protein
MDDACLAAVFDSDYEFIMSQAHTPANNRAEADLDG